MLTYTRKGLPIAIVGDSKFLVDCCLGRACTQDPKILRLLSIAQEALRQMTTSFSVKCFTKRELLIHTPRKDNAAADAAANKALDEGDFAEIWEAALDSFCEHALQSPDAELGLLFSFDGASRGNPGKASHGNCCWWGEWINGAFVTRASLFCIGRRTGRNTNNIAEAQGLAFAAKAALHFNFWFHETCTKVVEGHKLHSTRGVL